ncbi:cytochrome P450 6B6-like [Achroia grisella]|uniref:cytochrome P450 6B6-like n=1 Tax=Achroia grisella TaxID=688607 RepID=UPI0027D237E1|nr:cytochrome P450 6B6-like [Achroia grisella]
MIVLLLILCVIFIYFYGTKNHDYWSKRNIKHDPPIPLIGNQFRNQFALKSMTDIAVELYNKYPKEKVVGYYRWTTPELIIRDPEIARNILNVDFVHFYPRGLGRNPSVEPLQANLFHADGDTWKLLRQRMTSAFTTAKLKNMFPLVVKCAEKLQIVGKDIVSRGGECDVREIMARFTTEFIGACGFGIEMDTINNEHSLFRDLGKLIFNRTLKDVVRLMIWEGIPITRNYIPVFNADVENVIEDIVTKIRAQRNYKPCGRNDFIDLLLEMESKGKIKGESIERRNPDGTPIEVEMEMTLKCMVAQVFIFFAAGFETSSSATSFMLHQLAYNPDIQSKIQAEIDEVLSKYDNKLCYDAITEMSLLDMAFKESMRMFPSLGNLNRVCSRQYTIPELNVTIDPGVKIIIPIEAIQNDEQYFDNPKEFRPERFTPEAIKSRHHYTYLPFGEGPRACIGARLGHMQSLAGLAAILQTFTVEPTKATLRYPIVNPRSNVVQAIKGGLPLKLSFR